MFKAFLPAVVAPIVAGQLGPLADAVKYINARLAPLEAEANDCLQPMCETTCPKTPLANFLKGIAALALTEHWRRSRTRS